MTTTREPTSTTCTGTPPCPWRRSPTAAACRPRACTCGSAPLEAGLACYRCGTGVTYTSRSTRDAARPRCPRCGCSRRRPQRSPVRAAGRAAARAPTDARRRGRRPRRRARHRPHDRVVRRRARRCRCHVDRRAGPGHRRRPRRPRRSCGRSRRSTPGVVAVPSLGALGTSQAERLQVLFTLTHRGWRVVSADDVEVARPERPLRRWDLDELDDEPGDGRRARGVAGVAVGLGGGGGGGVRWGGGGGGGREGEAGSVTSALDVGDIAWAGRGRRVGFAGRRSGRYIRNRGQTQGGPSRRRCWGSGGSRGRTRRRTSRGAGPGRRRRRTSRSIATAGLSTSSTAVDDESLRVDRSS